MAYKILNKLSTDSLWNKYQYRFAYSNYITMDCKELQIPRLRTEHAKKGFYYSAIKAWNDIPANIRENTRALQKRTKSAPEELRMPRKNAPKHDLLEEQPIFFR